MMTPAFATAASVPLTASPARLSACSFVAQRAVAAQSRRASVRMQDRDSRIGISDYHDAFGDDDDCGDGFIGSANMDDSLGVSMPDDLASFERKEIDNCETREQLVEKLRDIQLRRRGVMDDRRRGMGLDRASNYLDNLNTTNDGW